MNRILFKPAAFSCILAIGFAGCNGGSGTPSPTPTPQIANLSGDYTGTLQDAQSGNATAAATLAQTGSNAGGAITATFTSMTLTPQITLAISPSNQLAGAMVIDYPNGTTCTFSTSGTYANNGSSTATITGSYTAVTNCAGDTGTYTLNQQCTDTVTSSDRRIMTYPPK